VPDFHIQAQIGSGEVQKRPAGASGALPVHQREKQFVSKLIEDELILMN